MSRAIALQLRALADQLEGAPGSTIGRVGPGMTMIQGAKINLLEPVASDWQPSMYAQQLGAYGAHVNEPSNAPPGNPRRSPSGYPLHYPGLNWQGIGTPTGPAMVLYGEGVFTDDAAVFQYKMDVAAQHRDNSSFSPGGPR